MIYEIPLSPEPQTFGITLAGREYRLTLAWNTVAEAWTLDVSGIDRTPLVAGLLIVTGVNLLGQFEHLQFGGRLFARTDGDPDQIPTLANLGTAGRLYFEVVE